MKFTAPLVSALSLFALSSADQCKVITDPDAAVWQNWPSYSAQAIAVLSKVDLNVNVSRCLASADISPLDLAGLFMNQDCKKTIREVMPNFNTVTKDTTLAPLYKDIFDHFAVFKSVTPANFIQTFRDWRNWIYGQSADVTSQICGNVRSNAVPCLEKPVNELLFSNVFDNECCDAFKQDFKQKYTGYDFTIQNVNRALRDLVNVPCTIQTPGFTGKSQTCQYASTQAILGANYMDNFKSLISTREETACNAANGEPFTTYSSTEKKQYARAIGCCAKPLDKVFAIVGSFPFVKKVVPISATAPGKCVKVDQIPFVQQLVEQAPQELKPVAVDFVKDLCVHLPVGYTKGCTFKSGTKCDSL